METELKSLQDKIQDLESKLNVANQPLLPLRQPSVHDLKPNTTREQNLSNT